MKRGILKIIVVAFAYLFTYIAELSFCTEYYYAASSAAFVVTACFSIFFAIKTRSNLLMLYASVYIVGAFLFSLMMVAEIAVLVDYIYYGAKVNFSIIITFADSFIISIGGISVIYRFYTLRRYGSDSDGIFDARLGLHKWAR